MNVPFQAAVRCAIVCGSVTSPRAYSGTATFELKQQRLPNCITEPDVAKGIREYYEKYAIPANSFANMVAFAMSQPEDVDINEILFRPTRQEL
jgi:NADP-dependent 3-hydroxy acid dehydrogenase YdfG